MFDMPVHLFRTFAIDLQMLVGSCGMSEQGQPQGLLVHLALFRSREWTSVILQLNDAICCFSRHVVNGILIS